MFRAEDGHWWYLGMEAITRALIQHWVQPSRSMRILDAGCGTGAAMTGFLARFGPVTGFDLSPLALRFCQQREARRLVNASIEDIPFASSQFDLVTSFDVLYEQGVRDDRPALAEIYRVLAPGGRLLVRLPAYDCLRGQHDRAVQTARRYTARQLSRLLRESGFTVEHISYANTLLFPLALIKRLFERLMPPHHGDHSDLAWDPGWLNGPFRAVLSFEAPLVARFGLPFGLSVMAIGRKGKSP
jgi:SAM-dependent methyltransferase